MPIEFNTKETAKKYEEPLTTINKDIYCAMCEMLIARTVQIKEIPLKNKYTFSCPKCGGKSFVTKFDYKMILEPFNCSIFNIEERDGIWHVLLKTK